MAKPPFKQRIGVDLGNKLPVEDGLAWASRNAVHYIDVQTDFPPNALDSFDTKRCRGVRQTCESHVIHLGLHTLSGVNVAEISPYCGDAVDEYLKAYIDLAQKINAEWIVVHGGYHFTACRDARLQASIERLSRIVEYAEKKSTLLLLENLNWEPPRAEVNYLPVTPAECRHFFEAINSPSLKWSFTANHAHFLPGVGIEKFIEAMDFTLCREVRLADNNGLYEIHQVPGEGTVDFGALFSNIEERGYRGHYTCGFGGLDDMLRGRDYMVDQAKRAGVDIGE